MDAEQRRKIAFEIALEDVKSSLVEYGWMLEALFRDLKKPVASLGWRTWTL